MIVSYSIFAWNVYAIPTRIPFKMFRNLYVRDILSHGWLECFLETATRTEEKLKPIVNCEITPVKFCSALDTAFKDSSIQTALLLYCPNLERQDNQAPFKFSMAISYPTLSYLLAAYFSLTLSHPVTSSPFPSHPSSACHQVCGGNSIPQLHVPPTPAV